MGALWKCAVQYIVLWLGAVVVFFYSSVWFTAAVVSRSWLKKKKGGATAEQDHALVLSGSGGVVVRHLTYFHLCSVSVRLSLPPWQVSSCWWLEA